MLVKKFGGSSLKDGRSIRRIAEIVMTERVSPVIVVLSALQGVTDALHEAVRLTASDEKGTASVLQKLEDFHRDVIREAVDRPKVRERVLKETDAVFEKLRRLLQGAGFTGEVTPRVKDEIMSCGERLSVRIMAGTVEAMGESAAFVDSDTIPLLAAGEWGNGTADLDKIRALLPAAFVSRFQKSRLLFVTGYFGCTEQGRPITFGRGGSDYAAALLADALSADKLEIWKDVDGFLSGSPEVVPDGRLLAELSYDEAAELAYFGAKILHPRTVEPLLEHGVPVEIKNTFRPDGSGTRISGRGRICEGIVKSVTFDSNVALVRVHGVDVGYTVGLLAEMVSRLSLEKINIRSVLTSQTCINILLNRSDLEKAAEIITDLHPEGVDAVEPVRDIGIVAVVGQGLAESRESLAAVINALYGAGIGTEMIVSGASRVAAYLIVSQPHLKDAVRIVHRAILKKQAAVKESVDAEVV